MSSASQVYPNPLLDLHRQAEAETQPYDLIEIASTFGEPEAEYAAVRKGCGMMDLPQRGILELSGRDRLAFLNNLLTNQTWDKQSKSGLPANAGVYAYFLNTRGRVVCDVNVLELGERTLLEMDVRLVEPVRAEFDKYLFAEQVKIESRVGDLHEIALHGPRSAELLGEALGAPLPDMQPLSSTTGYLFGHEVVIWRDDPAAVPGYHVIVSYAGARDLWMGFLARFSTTSDIGKRALRPIGWAAFNAARIEGARPLFGIDFDESVLPAETGQLDRAVSFTKGCYLGQEIVARMHARGQLARQLVSIRMDDDALPIAGTKVFDDKGNEIGGITSSTISPVLSNAAICVGYLKRPHFNAGAKVTIPAEGSMRTGMVGELKPMV